MSKIGIAGLKLARRIHYVRTAMIVAIFSGTFLIGCTKDKISQHIEDTGGSWFPKTLVVYAVEDIPAGKTPSIQSLEEREIALNRIPEDAVTGGASRVIKRITKFRIAAGQIIRYHDLFSEYGSEEDTIILSKEEQEKLEKKAAQNHKKSSELIKSWVLERLKK